MGLKIRPKRFGVKIAMFSAAFVLAAQPLVGVLSTRTAHADSTSYSENFSSGIGDWQSGGGYGTITATAGVATVTEDGGSGPFSRLGGYITTWQGDYKTSVDAYLDTSWASGGGFDYSVASNGSDGNHQRDFIAHVTKDTSTGQLLFAASNNTTFSPREDLETVNHYVVSSTGWYTIQHNFRYDAGVLAVDVSLLSGDTVLFTETRTTTADTIPAEVGGHRYAWFTDITIPGGLQIDNVSVALTTPNLTTPADGSIFKTSQLPQIQTWTAVPGATKYLYESYTEDPEANPLAAVFYSTQPTTTSRTIGTTAPEGKYWWRVKAVTPFTSEWSAARTFSVDNTAPSVEITNPMGTLYNTDVVVRGTVTDQNPRHYWLNIKRNGVVIHSQTVLSDSFTDQVLYTLTSDGDYIVTLAARDSAGGSASSGNRSGDVVVSFTIDKTAPDTPTLVSPGNGTPINGTSPVANDWSDVADADHYVYQSYNVDSAGDCNTSSIRFTSDYTESNTNSRTLAHGLKFCWRVKTVDAADNESAWSELWKTVVDNNAPSVPEITAPLAGAYLNGSSTINSWTAAIDSDSGIALYEVKYVLTTGTQFRTTTSLSRTQTFSGSYQGPITISVRAQDNAGNWSAYGAPVIYHYDSVDPVLVIPSYDTLSNVITPNVDADDANSPLTYAWTQTGGPTTGVTISDPTIAEPDFTVTEDGTYEFTLTATDPAGNSVSSTFSFTYTAPVGPVVTLTPVTPTITPVNQTPATGDGFTNVAVTANDNSGTGVLGAQTQNTSEDDDKDSTSILGATATPKADGDSTPNVLGLAWYWWLLILAAVGGFGWWLLAALRRRASENEA